jgi:CubicO group peptidase (beta-lactamase class C family)
MWLFAAAAFLAGCAPEITQATLDGPSPASIDAIFAEWDSPDSPGCVLGVFRDGLIVYSKGYGMANLDWGVPIEPSTVFYVGSVSKQFVATSIAMLDRREAFSLDDDIRRYLPELREYSSPVTIRHLVHHTGGIRGLYRAQLDSGFGVYTPLSEEEAIAVLADKPLDFEPGDRFSYSNGGYFLLAQIVERVSGMSFNQFTRANIFEPLGMGDSHFHDDPGHVVKRRAMSYEVDDETGEARQNYISTFNRVGPGGLYTTIGDLAQWDQNFYVSRVGGPGFTDYMLTRGTLNNGESIPYAFGLKHTDYRGLKVIDHAGGMMGFRADLVRFPGRHFSVAALCNSSNINPSALTRRVADLYLSDLPPG